MAAFNSLLSPFTNLFNKRPGASQQPSDPQKYASFTPSPRKPTFFSSQKPVAPMGTNYTPVPGMEPNASTLQGPRYFTPPSIPQIKASTEPWRGAGSLKPSAEPWRGSASPVATEEGIAGKAPTTPSGLTLDQAMAIQNANQASPVQTAPVASQAASTAAPVAPPAPFTPSPAQQKTLDEATAIYQKSLQMSPEELSTQEDVDRLAESARKSYTSIKDQAIPMEFITGQLASIERRATDLAEPLERKLARLQAARMSGAESSRFAIERADKAIESARQDARDIRGEQKDVRTDAESARRFGVEQKGKEEERTFGKEKFATEQAATKAKLEEDRRQVDRKFEEEKRQFGLEYAIKQREASVKELEAKTKARGEAGAITPYRQEKLVRTVQSVDELLVKAIRNPGIFGRTAALPIPRSMRSDAFRNFEAELTTLKSNIFSGELTAMREASKTGGAVGNVSDKEGEKLENALGALYMDQGPENIRDQLQKIKDSINRWRAAVGAQSIGQNFVTAPDGTQVEIID